MNVNQITQTNDVAVQQPARVDETAEAKQNRGLDGKEALQSTAVQEKEAKSAEELQEVAESLNEYMNDFQTQLGFFVNEDLNDTVIVEIKNRETDELIKQIPSEEVVAIREKMAELTGLLFDKSV